MKKQLIALGAFLALSLGAMPGMAASHYNSFSNCPCPTASPCCPACPIQKPCCPAAPLATPCCPAAPLVSPCCPAAPMTTPCCPAAPIKPCCPTTNYDLCD